jgi:hypothetical protein
MNECMPLLLLLFGAAGAAAVAAGSGYSWLGGIAAYSAALKEMVLLHASFLKLICFWWFGSGFPLVFGCSLLEKR